MATAAQFNSVIPEKFISEPPESASRAVLDADYIEIVSKDGFTNHTYQSNPYIHFHISSQTDFVDFANSYFRFKIQSNAAGDQYTLDQGLHGLFRSISVDFHSGGKEIQREQLYNTRVGLTSSLVSPEQDAHNSQFLSGYDSLRSLNAALAKTNGIQNVLTVTSTDIVHDGTTVTISANYDDYVNYFKEGDTYFGYDSGTGRSSMFTVQSITEAQPTVMTVNIAAGTGANVNNYTSIIRILGLSGPRAVGSNRMFIAADTDEYFLFRPDMSFFNLVLPLLIFRGGVDITLQLGNPDRYVVNSTSDRSTIASSPTITITEAHFVAAVMKPHPDIVESYLSQFKGSGFLYNLPSWKLLSITGSSGDGNVDLNFLPSVRSARVAIFGVQDTALSDTPSVISRRQPSLSAYVRSNISRFYLTIGSQQYPHRELKLDSKRFLPELAYRNCAAVDDMERFETHLEELCSVHQLDRSAQHVHNEARRFVIAVPLARAQGDEGFLTGADIGNVPLIAHVERSQNHNVSLAGSSSYGLEGSPRYYLAIYYDQVLALADGRVSRVN